MAIEKIGFRAPVNSITETAKAKEQKPSQSEPGDRVELSEEAKSMFAAKQAKQTEEVQEKIKNGFYFSPEVTEKVVDGLIRDLKSPR
ncbi:MAG: hypothetical protein KF749_00605 [Bacteroidetes bacterium]|nr:hypothetical protein [Bacteroidota bacterium]MCW5895129.1 hypothetical protein [Bacteroidota bacterium]